MRDAQVNGWRHMDGDRDGGRLLETVPVTRISLLQGEAYHILFHKCSMQCSKKSGNSYQILARYFHKHLSNISTAVYSRPNGPVRKHNAMQPFETADTKTS